MNLFAGTYDGEIYMLSGHPTNLSLRKRVQLSQKSIRALYLPEQSNEALAGGFQGQILAFSRYDLASTKQTKQPKGIITAMSKVGKNLLAVGHENGLIRFWDWKSWNLKKQIREHKKSISGFCLDKKQVVFLSAGGKSLVLWDIQKLEKVFHYKFDYEIEHVLTDNQFQFIFLLNQRQIHQIKAVNNQEVAVYKVEGPELIQSAVFFQDFIIVGGDKGSIWVWEKGNFAHKIHFQAHQIRVKAMKVFEYDQMSYLVTVSSTGEVKVWDILQFLKEVEKIGQDYPLQGLEPLCSVNINKRIICMEVGFLEMKSIQVQKPSVIQKIKDQIPIGKNKKKRIMKALEKQQNIAKKPQQMSNQEKLRRKKLLLLKKKKLLLQKKKEKQQKGI